MGTRKGMDEHLKLYNIFVYALIYAFIFIINKLYESRKYINLYETYKSEVLMLTSDFF